MHHTQTAGIGHLDPADAPHMSPVIYSSSSTAVVGTLELTTVPHTSGAMLLSCVWNPKVHQVTVLTSLATKLCWVLLSCLLAMNLLKGLLSGNM